MKSELIYKTLIASKVNVNKLKFRASEESLSESLRFDLVPEVGEKIVVLGQLLVDEDLKSELIKEGALTVEALIPQVKLAHIVADFIEDTP